MVILFNKIKNINPIYPAFYINIKYFKINVLKNTIPQIFSFHFGYNYGNY